MKFSAAVLAFAAGAMANKNITYVTEVVSAYTTYCPAATVITHGDKTYTVTSGRKDDQQEHAQRRSPRISAISPRASQPHLQHAQQHPANIPPQATTLTITDCPCTVTKPVITSSIVKCETCTAPTKNATIPIATPAVSKTAPATGAITPTKPVSVPTAGAGKAAALSGAGLAGVLGLAAFVL